MRVNDAHKSVQLHERVLERGRSEHERLPSFDRVSNRAGDFACRAIDVSHSVRLVNDNEVPGHSGDVPCFSGRELVGADDDLPSVIQRIRNSIPPRCVEGRAFPDFGREPEFLGQLLLPLFPQCSRKDQQDPAPPFRPFLRDDDPSFDCLAQPDSSAKIAPRASGERTAKSAASTWCGLRSTRALAIDREIPATDAPDPFWVSRCAQ